MVHTFYQTETKTSLDDLSFLWLEITEKCNLSCSHCYAESSPQGALYGSMSYENWCDVIDQGAEMGCRNLQFIGGEPTIHPRLSDLVDYANHRGYELIEVYTNATRLNKRLIDCFQNYGVHIATSFYSDNPIVHEEITHSKGSWHQTVNGIQTALAAGLSVRVGVVETNQNMGHSSRAIEFVKNLGIVNVSTYHEQKVGRAELIQPTRKEERYDQLCGQCWKGKLCVTSNGDVFPCVFSRSTRIGNITSGLQTLVQGIKLQQFRAKIRDLEAERAVSSCLPSDISAVSSCLPSDISAVSSCLPSDISAVSSCLPSDISAVSRCLPSDISAVSSCAPSGDISAVSSCAPTDISAVSSSLPSYSK